MRGNPPGWTPRPTKAESIGPAPWKPWAALGCGVAGGFLAAVVFYDSAGDSLLEAVLTFPVLVAGCAAFLFNLGRRELPVLPRVLLFVVAVGGGYRMGGALSYEVAGPPPQDLGKAASSPEGISAAILLGLGLAFAVYLSFGAVRARRRTSGDSPGPTRGIDL